MHSLVKRLIAMKRKVEVIKALKRTVEKDYSFKIKKWKVIKKLKNSSLVVKIVTKNGKRYALKNLYLTSERQQFIAKSEQLLAERGVKLASPVSTQNGRLLMKYNKNPYVLYEWIEGKSAALRNQDDLEAIVEAMARFHQASRQIQYPTNVKIYGHEHWEKEYKERIKTMEKWSKEHKSSDSSNAAIIKKFIGFFQKMAGKALQELQASRYDNYFNGDGSAKSLVHGDMHANNVIDRNNEKVFIDFEDVRYDLPSKDLLRLFSMYSKNHSFHGESFSSMLKKYENHHALSSEMKKLVLIDFMFPHIFERLLRKKKYVGMESKELRHRLKQEKKKAVYVYKKYFSNNQDAEGLF